MTIHNLSFKPNTLPIPVVIPADDEDIKQNPFESQVVKQNKKLKKLLPNNLYLNRYGSLYSLLPSS